MNVPVAYHNGVPHMPSRPVKTYRKVKKTVAFDSRDRVFTNTTNSNGDALPLNNEYVIQMPEALKQVYSVRLKEAEIPLSFYMFNSQNVAINCDTVGMNYNGLMTIDFNGTLYTVRIPDGSYTSLTTFAAAVQTGLNQAQDSTGTTIPGAPFTVTGSLTTGKLTITAGATPFTLLFSSTNYVLTSNTDWGLGYYMGFQKTDQVAVDVGGVYTLISDYPAIFLPYTYVFMELEFINKADETSFNNQRSGNKDSIFAKIPLTQTVIGGYTFHYDLATYETRSVLNPPMNKLQNIHVKFRFHDGTVPNFNNMEHSFLLEFELLDSNFDEFSSLETSIF